MKVRDLLSITEHGTTVVIYNNERDEVLFTGRLGFDDWEAFGSFPVSAINTHCDDCELEVVVKVAE